VQDVVRDRVGIGPSTAEPPSGIVSVGKESGRFTSTAGVEGDVDNARAQLGQQ